MCVSEHHQMLVGVVQWLGLPMRQTVLMDSVWYWWNVALPSVTYSYRVAYSSTHRDLAKTRAKAWATHQRNMRLRTNPPITFPKLQERLKLFKQFTSIFIYNVYSIIYLPQVASFVSIFVKGMRGFSFTTITSG